MNNTPDFWIVYFQRHPEKMMGDYDKEIHELAVKALKTLELQQSSLDPEVQRELLFNPQSQIDKLTKHWFLELHPDFATEYREWQSQQNLKVGVSALMINNM